MKLLDFWPFKPQPVLREQVALGKEAKDLWQNEAFKRAMARIRDGIHEKWENSPVIDRDGQHELRLMLKLLHDVEGNIRSEMNNGALAEATMTQEAEADKRKNQPIQFRR